MDQLIISNISKTYPSGIKALSKVSLRINKGIFGLLGPNGAGKSSLIRTIATLQSVDEGSVFLGKTDLLKQQQEVRKVLGYLPQEFGLYPRITAERLLNHFAVLKGYTHRGERKELVEHLLHQVNLYEVRKQKLGGFSGGMKRRFGIAQALLNNPKLLIVDEPTAGLDPEERHRFFDLLSEMSERSIVILSTHIVDDIEALCSRMAIISKGEILVEGDPRDFIKNLKGKIFTKSILKEELEANEKSYQVLNKRLLLGRTQIGVFSERMMDNDFHEKEVSLEDVYLYHTSKAKSLC